MSTEPVENSLGIPTADFVEDVDAYMKKQPDGMAAVEVIKRLDELRQKYKFMEQNLLAKRNKLNNQIPDIQNNLEALRFLKEKKTDFETSYLLDYHVYSRAKVPPTNSVGLWLGANVMLEYPISEAQELLTKNNETAKRNLIQVDLDLDFLKDQMTTTEVNIARVYNWDVRRRQAANVITANAQVQEPQS